MEGIFLHTGWRSSGSWLWQRLRDQPGHMGFYEPLHEFLPIINQAQLAELSPQSWASRHGATIVPYFAEYAPLLRPDGQGVRLAQKRFAFSQFFLNAAAQDEALAAYFTQLVGLARERGRLPVFKCTRSQGRLPWFRTQFPHWRHVALIRQPWTQFRSAWRCHAQDGNKYFLAAPFLVLERNTGHRDVGALAQGFGLPLGWGRYLPLNIRLKGWKLAVQVLDAGTLYKAHFALWLLNTVAACGAADMVLDGDAPPATLAGAFGLEAGRGTRPVFTPPPHWPELTAAAVQRIHETGLRTLAYRINPAMAARLRLWLGEAETMAARDLCEAPQAAAVFMG